MHRDRIASILQAVGALGLASLLLYGGFSLGGSGGAEAVLWTLLGLALAYAGVWGLSRLETSPAAVWVVLAVAGVGPASAALGWFALSEPGGVAFGLLVLALATGLATLGVGTWLLAAARGGAAARRRVARVG